jgi:uncharacterized membrane protein YfcA
MSIPSQFFELGIAPDIAALLVLVAMIAGFVDAIAGGGGLITVPALLLAGLSPVSAVATNKLQGTFGVASSTLAFWRAGRIERALIWPFFLAGFLGGLAGAFVVTLVPPDGLRSIIPFILVALAIYVLLSPKLGDADARPRLAPLVFAETIGFVIGAYDGFLGPGAGTFYLVGLILLSGFQMVRAVAHTKLLNFASNLGALLFFLAAGKVMILLGLMMGMGAATGAWLGARTTLRFGAALVRPLVVTVALLMALRLLLDAGHPVGMAIRSILG